MYGLQYWNSQYPLLWQVVNYSFATCKLSFWVINCLQFFGKFGVPYACFHWYIIFCQILVITCTCTSSSLITMMISEILWLASNIKNIHQKYTLSNWSRCFSCKESFISDFVPPRKVSITSLLCDSSILKNCRVFDWYIICSIFTSIWKIDLFEIHTV